MKLYGLIAIVSFLIFGETRRSNILLRQSVFTFGFAGLPAMHLSTALWPQHSAKAGNDIVDTLVFY
jgi:hypothetical protein